MTHERSPSSHRQHQASPAQLPRAPARADRAPAGEPAAVRSVPADVLRTGGFTNCVKLDPRKPSNTLPKMQTGRGFATLVHWAEARAISIPEALRIGSFPDEFRLTGDYQTQWMRIGNSVPPRFMFHIAAHIRDTILSPASAQDVT